MGPQLERCVPSWARIFKKGAKKLERMKQSPTENSKNGQGWRSMTHGNRMMPFSLIKRKSGRDIINGLPVGARLLLQAHWLTAFDVLQKTSQKETFFFFFAKKFSTFVLRFEDNFHDTKTYRRGLAQAAFPLEKGGQDQHSPSAGGYWSFTCSRSMGGTVNSEMGTTKGELLKTK